MLSRLFIAALWSPAGKGLTFWLLFVVFNCIFVITMWYLRSGVELDCINSQSFSPFLLSYTVAGDDTIIDSDVDVRIYQPEKCYSRRQNSELNITITDRLLKCYDERVYFIKNQGLNILKAQNR